MDELNREVVGCMACFRLVEHRQAVNIPTQPKKWRGTSYWSKPVPGFGDLNAEILVVGLAPGLHGANRTGRPFTGDGAGIMLYKTLHAMGWASRPDVESADDGQTLTNVYITNIVKCVPPGNVPNGTEKNNCRPFLMREIKLLPALKYILALGGLAHNEMLKIFKAEGIPLKMKDYPFVHGSSRTIPGTGLKLVDCYHPSTYNVNTGVINDEMMLDVLRIMD